MFHSLLVPLDGSAYAAATSLEGPVAASLYRQAITTRVDLVVMTVIGPGLGIRLWVGSVADELVRWLPMPLLLLRSQEPAPEMGREPTIKQMLLPLDGSEAAEQVVEPAAALGTLMQAEFTLLRIVNPVAPVLVQSPRDQSVPEGAFR